MYDHENRRPRGFGFITFAEEEVRAGRVGRAGWGLTGQRQAPPPPLSPPQQQPHVPPRPSACASPAGG